MYILNKEGGQLLITWSAWGGGGLKEILIFPTYFSLPLPVRKE